MLLIPGNLPSVASPVQYQYIENVACAVAAPCARASDRVSALPAEAAIAVIPKQRIAEVTAKLLNIKRL